MRNRTASQKNIILFILSYFLIWVFLFEFILPANEILPKPSIVFLSFGALWKDYHLLINLLNTITSIYISIFAAYFFLAFMSSYLTKPDNLLVNFFLSINRVAVYIPVFVFVIFILFWFPVSNIIEIIFAFIYAFFSLTSLFIKESEHVSNEYLDSALSLGADEKTISKKIIWNAVQPRLFKQILKLHFNLWSILIIFEFIKGGYGLGEIFKLAFEYRDISALFSVTIITAILIYLGRELIIYLKNKFCHWSFN
jgi:NitT/TauT family transport system permease protein